jgi:hypothetical protein
MNPESNINLKQIWKHKIRKLDIRKKEKKERIYLPPGPIPTFSAQFTSSWPSDASPRGPKTLDACTYANVAADWGCIVSQPDIRTRA